MSGTASVAAHRSPIHPGPYCTVVTEIDKLLAIGGFSAVYLAGDLQNGGKPVAVKDMICNEPQEHQVRLAFFNVKPRFSRL